MNKPLLAFVITDGAPNVENVDTFEKVVAAAKSDLQRQLGTPGALAIQVAQVGRDQGAQDYLHYLDVHPVVGSMIDCTSYYEMEQQEYMRTNGIDLTPHGWLLKMCLGAIDPEYGAKDD